ncbi:MAG: hypothetical protein CMO34_00580, partial [Verrucomicrobia bacterium]|nr:hypothetical protein [Verrucomicrobiota bacterium]
MKKETAIDQAVQCLRSGGTALLPTDSLWSICCDPKNAEALKKITQLKTALHKNDFTLLVPNERLMYQCVREVPDIAWDMIEITSSPLSLILESNAYLPKEIHCEDKKVIVRFIKEGSMHHILHQMNRPLLSMPALTPEGKP